MTRLSTVSPARPGLLGIALWPVDLLFWLLDRLSWTMDSSAVSQSAGAARIRRVLAALFLVYAVALSVLAVDRGGLPSWGQVLMAVMALALLANRGGRFVRDWVPVILGFVAYALAGQFAERLDFAVHYKPQIDADRVIGLGTVPTLWLQHHLYHGTTGALEIFSMVMYLSHFFAPLFLGLALWWWMKGRGFSDLMFGLLIVSVLGEITFVLAPTAPPWLAAEHGFLPPVHHVIKQGLSDLHLGAAAAAYGSAGSYNVVAAVPSLHVAWPVIGLLVIRKHRLPRWLFAAQAAQLAGVIFAIVYTGEHYAFDAVAGAAYALAAWGLLSYAVRAPGRLPGPAFVPGPRQPQVALEVAHDR